MMRKYLLPLAGLLAVAGCKKKPQGPDEFTKAYYAAQELSYDDLEAASDSLYSLYKNNSNYKDEEKLREVLFLSANWAYGAVGQTDDTAKQHALMAKAVPRYVEFLKEFPQSPATGQAYKELAYCQFMLKKYEDCVRTCQEMIDHPIASTSQYLPYAYKYAGRAYTYLKKKDSAIIYLKEAYRLFDAQAYLGEAKAMEEDLKKLGAKNIGD